MTKRSPITVLLLSLTGIYALYWMVKSKDEMNAISDAKLSTGWMLIVPIANLIWLWKFCGAAEKITNGKQSQAVAFLMMFVVSPIAYFMLQGAFNDLTAQSLSVAQAA